jgi:myo-inositol 2-dehydrogenase/D-chiro-inositol 1-dehydrogenase
MLLICQLRSGPGEGGTTGLAETRKLPLRLGLIGCGWVVEQCHLPALHAVRNIEVVAVSDNDPVRLDKVADRLGVRQRYSDYRAMLADRAVDAVAVCAPPQFHLDMGLAVIDAGKHLFLEKPIALNLDDADRLVESATRAATKTMTGFNWRWHRLIRQSQRIVAGGELGTVVAIHSAFSSATTYSASPSNWRNRDDLGGGVLFDLGIHHFDLWQFLLQCPVEEVFAKRSGEGSASQCIVVTASMANGALITSSFSHDVSNTNEIEICGTKGRLSLSCYRPDSLRLRWNSAPAGAVRGWIDGTIAALRNAPRAASHLFNRGDVIESYRTEWRHFVEAVHNNSIVECDFEDGRNALRVTHAVLRSLSTGDAVRVAKSGE